MALIDPMPFDSNRVAVRPDPPALTGEHACAGCGYRILRSGVLPQCPMCHRRVWRLVAWRPFTRPGRPGSPATGGRPGP